MRRSSAAVGPARRPHHRREGSDYVNFASNDYLAIRFHAALIARAVEWAGSYGVGSGASRLVTGNLDLFAPIEAKVAKLKRKPAALVMASGFQTNAAVLAALFDAPCSAPSLSSSPTGSTTRACISAARPRAWASFATDIATRPISPSF